MLPLIPLAISLVPGLTKWLFGAQAADTVQAVANVVQQVTGTADPAAASAAIVADPKLANTLTVQLAQIAASREAAADASRQAELVTTLADIASARGQTVALGEAKSPIAWGAPVLSAIVLVTFGAMLGFVLNRSIPQGSEALANVMLGTLAAMSTQVANYWLGSSAGSAKKSDDLAVARSQLAKSVPVSGHL